MKEALLVALLTYAVYMTIEQKQYKASWRVHAFAIVAPILILKFAKNLDIRAKLFIMTILAWHIISVLDSAIGETKNNDKLVHRHADPEGDASGLDAGVGSFTREVSQECGEAQGSQS